MSKLVFSTEKCLEAIDENIVEKWMEKCEGKECTFEKYAFAGHCITGEDVFLVTRDMCVVVNDVYDKIGEALDEAIIRGKYE